MEDMARAGALKCPPPSQTMALPAGHSAIISPGAAWHCREDNKGLMWNNAKTGSVVAMQPSSMVELDLSAGELAKAFHFTLLLEALLEKKYQEAKVTLEQTEVKEPSFNGMPFLQITMGGEVKLEDLSARFKVSMYVPRLKTFKYEFALMSLKERYDKDRYTVEHMLGGATSWRRFLYYVANIMVLSGDHAQLVDKQEKLGAQSIGYGRTEEYLRAYRQTL